MTPRKLFLFLIIPAVILFLAFNVFLFQKEMKKSSLPVLGQVSDFELLDSEGKKFSLANLKNKIWVADFIFTTCGGICPIMTRNMSVLRRNYNSSDLIHLVSISVNPDTDSPAVLHNYAQTHQADTRTWHFLTGSSETIKSLAVASFKLGSVEEPIFHSSYFVLVDARNQIRGYYDGTKPEEVQKLSADMLLLLKEKNS